MSGEEGAFRFFVSYAVASDRYEQTRDLISQIVPEPDTVVSPEDVREISESIEVTQELFADVYRDYSALIDEDVSEGIMQQVTRSYGWVRRWDEQASMWMAGLEHKIWRQRNGYLDQLREETEDAARRFGLRLRPQESESDVPDDGEDDDEAVPEDEVPVEDAITDVESHDEGSEEVIDGWRPAAPEEEVDYVGDDAADPVEDAADPEGPSESVPEQEGADDAELFTVKGRATNFYDDLMGEHLYTEYELRQAMRRGMEMGMEMGRNQAMAESGSADDAPDAEGAAQAPEESSEPPVEEAPEAEPQTVGTAIRRTAGTKTASKPRKTKRGIRRKKEVSE